MIKRTTNKTNNKQEKKIVITVCPDHGIKIMFEL